jgi:hypothetical protein
MRAEKRIEALESQIWWLQFVGLIMCLAVFFWETDSNHIELHSPNGSSTIRIEAGDEKSGIWVTRGDGQPHVSMWNYLGGGVGVGVYGANTHNNMDAALSTSKSGGLLQLTNTSNHVKIYTTESLSK